MKPGTKNLITDVSGLTVGNTHDETLKSGATVILCEKPMVASVAVHGGAPGSRELSLLEPENSIEGVDALVLSGGSSFGLDTACGVQAWLREKGRGFKVGTVNVPIVPGAILFDLINGGNKDWGKFPPYRDFGWDCAEQASSDFEIGSVGAGAGASTAGLKGGLGSASIKLDNGITIGALFAVNALGSPTIGDTRHFQSAIFEQNAEFGGYGLPSFVPENAEQIKFKFRDVENSLSNTTIGVVATDAVLTKAQAKRLAIAAHDGIARAIWPAHTPMDGDLVFAISSNSSGIVPTGNDWLELGGHAASVTSRAISRGVYSATPQKNDIFPVYSEKFRS